MSFASSLAVPANMGLKTARSLMQTPNLGSMARAIGIVLGAGMLAASHQIAYEEGRLAIANLRNASGHRRARNTALTLALMNSGFPLELQDRLRRSRDAIGFGLAMLTDERALLTTEQRNILHDVLTRITHGEMSLEA
jgi:hypothetical protein